MSDEEDEDEEEDDDEEEEDGGPRPRSDVDNEDEEEDEEKLFCPRRDLNSPPAATDICRRCSRARESVCVSESVCVRGETGSIECARTCPPLPTRGDDSVVVNEEDEEEEDEEEEKDEREDNDKDDDDAAADEASFFIRSRILIIFLSVLAALFAVLVRDSGTFSPVLLCFVLRYPRALSNSSSSSSSPSSFTSSSFSPFVFVLSSV